MRERGKISYRVLPDATRGQRGVLYVY